MIRSAPAFALTIAMMLVVLGVASALACRWAAVGEYGLAFLAAAVALAATTTITVVAATAPLERRAPTAVCVLIAVYAFVASFALPIDGGQGLHDHHAGHVGR